MQIPDFVCFESDYDFNVSFRDELRKVVSIMNKMYI